MRLNLFMILVLSGISFGGDRVLIVPVVLLAPGGHLAPDRYAGIPTAALASPRTFSKSYSVLQKQIRLATGDTKTKLIAQARAMQFVRFNHA